MKSATVFRTLLPALAVSMSACVTSGGNAPTDPVEFGTFDAPVRAEWGEDGREMLLLREAVFRDKPQSIIWTAPRGARIDGASVPRVFWSLLTGPYEGLHRDASVNHDYECCVKSRPWREVHRMYYDAMRARGESAARAKLMYFAVYMFGPRWPAKGEESAFLAQQATRRQGFTEGDAARAKALFERADDMSLDDIERLTPQSLRARVAGFASTSLDLRGLDDARAIEIVDKIPPCVVPVGP